MITEISVCLFNLPMIIEMVLITLGQYQLSIRAKTDIAQLLFCMLTVVRSIARVMISIILEQVLSQVIVMAKISI